MSHMMLYIMPLILGRTFDMNRMRVGIDIFPKEEILNPIEIQNPMAQTSYSLIDSTNAARNLLDVSGAFNLNIKTGIIKGGVNGAYLKDTFDRENTVEVAIKATYQTITQTLQPNAQPMKSWQEMQGLGTHYVRSITYGSELIASIRMICKNTKDKQNIKAGLDIGGRIEIFDLGMETEMEYLKEIANMVDKIQIKVFSSVPLENIPNDMNSLQQLMSDFPKLMKNYNNGNGVPLKMELWPLEYLNPAVPKFVKNKILDVYLETFEDKFDDLLNTKTAINDWMKTLLQPLSEENEKKISTFYREVTDTLDPFYEVIGNLELSKGIEQLKLALDKYGQNFPGIFYRRYQQLRQATVADQGDWIREKGSGVTYIHWGKSNCSIQAETLQSGYAVGAEGTSGGGSNYLCLPRKPARLSDNKLYNNGTILNSIWYKFPSMKTSSELLCTSCRLIHKGSIQIFAATSQCPNGWSQIYQGMYMSGSSDTIQNSFVCLELEAERNEVPNISMSPLFVTWIKDIKTQQQIFKIVPCVVCAK